MALSVALKPLTLNEKLLLMIVSERNMIGYALQFKKSCIPFCDTGIPLFESLPYATSLFTKDLHLYLFSLTERNLKRIFVFTKKGKKQK